MANSRTFEVSPVEPSDKTYEPLPIEAIGERLNGEIEKQVDNQHRDVKRTEYALKCAKEAEEKDVAKIEKLQSEFDRQKAAKEAAGDKAKVNFEFGTTNYDLVDLKSYVKHQMLATVVEAYNHHLPLELSADDFWVLIAQGVAQFLGGSQEMAEKYRHKFVEHEGKKELVVVLGPGQLGPPGSEANKKAWPILANGFRDKIIEATSTDLSEIITRDFSTTGDVERVVFSGTLMETMKNYFQYRGMCLCGLPNVTLHGSVEDYEDIIKRLGKIREIFPDLEWWVDTIMPHMQEILESVKGNVDQQFWRKMVFKVPEGSGGQTRLSGWLGEFVPFVDAPNGLQRNKNSSWNDLPYGVSFTDVILQMGMTGEKWQVKLSTGFLGAHQDATTMALRPVMGWLTFYDASSATPAQA